VSLFEALHPADAVAKHHPKRSWSIDSASSFASFIASSAAPMAKRVNRSIRRASRLSTKVEGSKPFTSPAIFAG